MKQVDISYDPIEAIADWMLRSRSGGFEELMDLGCFLERNGWWTSQQNLMDRFARAVDFKNRDCEERVSNILMLAVMGYTTREIGDVVGLSATHISRILHEELGECYKTIKKLPFLSKKRKKGEEDEFTKSVKNCYDKPVMFQKDQLVNMYLREGLSERRAKRQAKKVFQELRRLEDSEKIFWSEVRHYEDIKVSVTQHSKNTGIGQNIFFAGYK